MDPFNSSPLREWRLETTFDDSGQRCHGRSSGDECWRAVQCLGNGTFGDVWQEECVSGPSQNAVRAVKHLHKRQSKFLEMSRRELDALVAFSDSHSDEYKESFVQFLGWFDDADHFYITMEFLEYGDLQKYITAPFPEPEAASIVTQVARALQHMHNKNFVHRDIKPLNILVSSPGPHWHVKVADFGIAKKTDGTALGTHHIGTPGYMAPELYGSSDEYTAAVDIWALGAVAFCLRTGFPPFRTVKHLLDYARDHRVQFPIRPLGTSSGFCMNFVLGTMSDLPERRFTIEHVLAHDWLSGQSATPDDDELGVNSAATSGTGSISLSNAWSNTYDNTRTQQRAFSPPTPMTDPEIAAVRPHTSPGPPEEQASGDQLAGEVEKLKVADNQGEQDSKSEHLEAEYKSTQTKWIQTLKDIARYHHQEGRYDLAENMRKKVVNLVREQLSSAHPDTIDALALLSETYYEQKKYQDCVDIDQEVFYLRQSAFGGTHPSTLKALRNLAVTYSKLGKYEKAATYFAQLHSVQRKALGSGHPDTVDTSEQLSAVQKEAEKAKEAEMKAESVAEWSTAEKHRISLQKQAEQRDKEFRQRLKVEFGYTDEEIADILLRKTMKDRAEQRDKEFRQRLKVEFGYTGEEIAEILHRKAMKDNKDKEQAEKDVEQSSQRQRELPIAATRPYKKDREEDEKGARQSSEDQKTHSRKKGRKARKPDTAAEQPQDTQEHTSTPAKTWIKVHHKYLLPETLNAYQLPWMWDENDTNYIIIKTYIDENLQEDLFAHTRRLRRSGRQAS